MHGEFSAARVLAGVVAITFLASVVALALFGRFGLLQPSWSFYLLFALALTAVIVPPVYLLVLYPAQRALTARPAAPAPAPATGPPPRVDPLTQVLTQPAVIADLLEAIAQAERYDNPLSLAVVDVDGLDAVNRQYGQAAGDRVLQTVAGILSEALRMPDRIGRYGEDEFLLILPQTTADDAATLADRLRGTVARTAIPHDDQSFKATVSIGLTRFNKGDDMERLLSRLKAAMEEAKAQGSNRVVTRLG